MFSPVLARKIVLAADRLEAWLGEFGPAIIAALAMLVVALILNGCAEFETRQPIADRGTVLLTWEVDPSRVPGNHCGWAQEIARGHYLITFKRKYTFDDLCVVHELQHAFGGDHQ